MLKSLELAQTEIKILHSRIDELEKSHAVPDSLPVTNLLSDSFLTCAFAVYGHMLVAGLIIAIPIYLVAFIIGLTAGGF